MQGYRADNGSGWPWPELCCRTRLLILDEATSALDARTERQVCNNLFEAFEAEQSFSSPTG